MTTVTNRNGVEFDIDDLITDLNNKADKDLANITPAQIVSTLLSSIGMSFVIESGSEDDRWYRLYSDGWCEQGGGFGASYASYTNRTFSFLKPFRDINYMATCHCASTGDLYFPSITAKTTASVTFYGTYNNGGYGNWYACGWVAPES